MTSFKVILEGFRKSGKERKQSDNGFIQKVIPIILGIKITIELVLKLILKIIGMSKE